MKVFSWDSQATVQASSGIHSLSARCESYWPQLHGNRVVHVRIFSNTSRIVSDQTHDECTPDIEHKDTPPCVEWRSETIRVSHNTFQRSKYHSDGTYWAASGDLRRSNAKAGGRPPYFTRTLAVARSPFSALALKDANSRSPSPSLDIVTEGFARRENPSSKIPTLTRNARFLAPTAPKRCRASSR